MTSGFTALLAKVSGALTRNVALVILALSAVAFAWPGAFSWAVGYTSEFLALIMFGMGLTISAADFKVVFAHPKEVVIGAVAQYTVMPLSAWALACALQLPADLALGVILVGCCPGGTASNVITYLAKGDVALSVGMTAVSTLIAPVMTPLLVFALAGSWVEVSFPSLLLSVAQVVLAPIAAGIIVNALAKRTVERVSGALPLVSVIAIAVIVAGITANNTGKILESGALVLAVVALHNGIGMAAGYAIARLGGLDYPKVTAVAVEVGMQNSGLAVSLAASSFAANPLATLPGAVFSVWHNVAGSVFAGWRAREPRAGS